LPRPRVFGIEALRVADREFQVLLLGESDQLVGLGELHRDGLLEEHVLARREAVARDRVVRGFRGGRDVHGLDLTVVEQPAIVGDRALGACDLRHLGEALGADLREVQALGQGMGGAGLGTYAAAPARTDDGDSDLFHGTSSRAH